MLIELPVRWIVVLNVAGWPFIQLGLAWLFIRLPLAWFRPGEPFKWEQDGRIYDRLFGIKRWKERLPDGAAWFAGGFSKANLSARRPDYLQRFAAETWRGELCHWMALGFVPLFFLWNPWWGDLIMVAYALAANGPCILAQRYNRARFSRLAGMKSAMEKRSRNSPKATNGTK